MTPVALYARYSTDRQDSHSIEDQLRRCREYAARNGYQVVTEYSDAAISGTHSARPGLQRMLAAVAVKRPPFGAVIVDDLSRLSRDIGDTHTIVFRDLAGHGVKVLDTAGLDSESDSGEAMITMRSVFSREYVRAVSKATHRGLSGRALAGYATGGVLYGFRTELEAKPTDAEHPRKVWTIDEGVAGTIQRIFDLYDQGAASYKSIAATLNEDGIPAPRDGKKSRKTGRGWTYSTVRAILRNEKYVGRFTWNTSKWVRVGSKRKRRARPASEHMTRELPELAIVDRATWGRVQARIARVHKGGRPAGSGRNTYLVSGLLRCGTCGGPMSANGVSGSQTIFTCTAARSSGKTICPNSAGIREGRITSALLGALRDLLSEPDVADRFVAAFVRRVARGNKAPANDLNERIAEAESRVRNITAALARMPDSEALYGQLASEESTLKALRSQAKPSKKPSAKPTRAVIRASLSALVDSIEREAPAKGREALARVVTPIALTKRTDGTWDCRGAFRLAGLSANTGIGCSMS